jgi:light-regulated signal transduction histidine kinase (bacteriophytochrome)
VSHDLRAPIRSIVGYTQIVLAAYQDQLPAEALRDLEQVRQGGFLMSHLVDSLLEYLNIRKHVMLIQSIEMQPLVYDVWEELTLGEADRTPIKLDLQELPPCMADRELMKILWLKLLDNALKFTRLTQAHIEIGWLSDPSGSIYYVRDNGTGFDMRYADKIFDAFERLHRVEDFQGAGLGLAISKRIVERHHGRIWVESAPNQGATFFFTLSPISKDTC